MGMLHCPPYLCRLSLVSLSTTHVLLPLLFVRLTDLSRERIDYSNLLKMCSEYASPDAPHKATRVDVSIMKEIWKHSSFELLKLSF